MNVRILMRPTIATLLYHTRIRIWYNHTRMVRIIVPYAYGACKTTGAYS